MHTTQGELCSFYRVNIAKIPEDELMPTKNTMGNVLLSTWKPHHLLTLGDTLHFDSVNLGGGTECRDGTEQLEGRHHGHRMSKKKQMWMLTTVLTHF